LIWKPETRNQKRETCAAMMLLMAALLLPACRQKMADQPRYDPLEASNFFPDGQSARPLVENTVARGTLGDDELFYNGTQGGAPATLFPFPITMAVMQRGQERFNIYCSPCHARTGTGEGMIPSRGFTRPQSFHSDRLRSAPHGYIFQVITNGFAAMPSYRQQIPPADRWAIIAYVRALQLSHTAKIEDVPAAERAKISGAQR
jgi:mono/diheme cytochrome c family protein